MNFPLVSLIGAARSGTTLLAEHLLAHHPDINYWSEPNHIWNVGNLYSRSDLRGARDADAETTRYIRRQFREYHQEHTGRLLLEKTPSNCLRIPFIREIFPQAKFVHLVRDGRDVTLSAAREWRASGQQKKGGGGETGPVQGLLQAVEVIVEQIRLRKMPGTLRPSQLPYYALRAFQIVQSRLLGRERMWGPRILDLKKIRRKHSLLETCAIQWRDCVDCARRNLAKLPAEVWMEVRYEDLLAEPEAVMVEICEFMGLSYEPLAERIATIDSTNAQKWPRELSERQHAELMALIGETLEAFDYV